MSIEIPGKPGLSKFMREARIRKGFSAAGLARVSGVSRQTILDAESGARNPRPNSLKRIADSLEITVDDLINGEEARPSGLRAAYNKAQREPMRRSHISQAMLEREQAEAGRLTLSDSIAIQESPTRAAAVKAWMDFYEMCLRPSVRASVMDQLTSKARREEIGPRDVLKVFGEILDDYDDRLREYELATEWELNNPPYPPDPDEQEPAVPGGEK
jgi:transcriptional regulator with XRE-family HTH domain